MKRLLAVIGAVAMIGGSILVRGAMTGDGGGGANGSSGGGGTHLICATELEAACRALAEEDDSISFDVEEAGVIAERLVDPAFATADENKDIDGWLTLNPWPGLVDLRRDIAGDGAVLGEQSDVLATSPIDLVGPTDRVDALFGDVCDTEPEHPVWRCLGDNAGARWGDVGGSADFGSINVGYADPTTSATGLLVLGQSSAEFFDAFNDRTFARNDLDSAFSTWLGDLNESNPSLPTTTGSPLDQLLQYGESSWDAVGDVDWIAKGKVAGSRDEDELTVTYSSFMLAEAVAVPILGHEIPDFTDGDYRSALADAGYTNLTDDTDPATTVSPISAGVYEALIEQWEQAT